MGFSGRWLGLDEALGVRPHDGLVPYEKRHWRACFLSATWGTRRWHLQARKQALTRTWLWWHSDLGLPASRVWETNVYYLSQPVYHRLSWLLKLSKTDSTWRGRDLPSIAEARKIQIYLFIHPPKSWSWDCGLGQACGMWVCREHKGVGRVWMWHWHLGTWNIILVPLLEWEPQGIR